eukprot:3168933-Pleurochrysis_carterae.AAC.4
MVTSSLRWRGLRVPRSKRQIDEDDDSRTTPQLFMHDDSPASWGKIDFARDSEHGATKHWSRYACLSSETDSSQIMALLNDFWALDTPTVLFSAIGSEQALKLGPHLEMQFRRALASVASSTRAWTFTSGFDQGIAALVGAALASASKQTPCIGIASWRKTMHREVLHNEERPAVGNTCISYRACPSHFKSLGLYMSTFDTYPSVS